MGILADSETRRGGGFLKGACRPSDGKLNLVLPYDPFSDSDVFSGPVILGHAQRG
jgi:hypothetical protein